MNCLQTAHMQTKAKVYIQEGVSLH